MNNLEKYKGVTFVNPVTITIEDNVEIEEGSKILPGCYLHGDTKIGKNCVVGPNTELFNAVLEDEVTCTHSVIYDSKIKSTAKVGPFTHLRMNTTVGEGDRIGNFVEIKNSTIDRKTNVSHLTYVGDTDCGAGVNFGCGVVTVNYDGKNKFRTTIGDNVFIGCNSNLIAPVTLATGSFVAAGSTINHSLAEDDFAIARARQETKKGYAKHFGYKKV